MIEINLDRCTGCGQCMAVCSAGALRIDGGHAVVDQALCRCCGACISACPLGALSNTDAPVAVAEPQLPQALSAAIDVLPARPAPVPWTQRIMPALAGALRFAGQEILPRILEGIAATPQERGSGRGNTINTGEGGSGGGQPGRRYRARHGRG